MPISTTADPAALAVEAPSTLAAPGTSEGEGSAEVASPGGAAVGGGQGRGLAGPTGGTAGRDDALARIQALLAARAAACYPPAAARLGLTGTTRVRFCVGPGGAPTEVEVQTGSGEGLLDRAATDCVVRGAAPLPALEKCVSLPVEFRRR